MSAPSLGGYTELEQIGKGGFSRVFRGHQTKFSRQVAIKVLNIGLADPVDRRNFERETQLMGRVSAHPNIVTVHDIAFTSEGQPCIVMELYAGGSVADLMKVVKRLDVKETLDVGVAIASALAASHQAGVLHCDIKPQNILISEFGQPALGDFGISTFVEERTRTGAGSGAGFTLHYAAPEVIEGAPPSPRSDLYSLAATLYTALAGHEPFASRQGKQRAGELARRVLLEDAAPLTTSGIDEAVDELIRRAMSKDPQRRPTSAESFAHQLYSLGTQLGLSTIRPRTTSRTLPTGETQTPDVVEEIDLTRTTLARPLAERARRGADARVASPRTAVAKPVARVAEVDLRESERGHSTTSAAGTAFDDTPRRLDATPAAQRQRQWFAAGIGLLSIVVVATTLWFFVRGGDTDPDGNDAPATSIEAPSEGVPEFVLAPSMPTDVSLKSDGSGGALVTWASPDTDVTFEVRRTDIGGFKVVTRETQLVLEDPPSDQALCVTVMAVRQTRIAGPTDPVCATITE